MNRIIGRDIFITGTDTGVGKTLLAALLVAALARKYWKPIQTGSLEGTDRETVMRWAGVAADQTHPEAFVFSPPVSPHLAAEARGIRLDLSNIRRPVDEKPIVIEGAGGLLVPVNDEAYMLDLIQHLDADVIVAARTTLGTINHTLLTLAALRRAGIPALGVVMIGKEDPGNRRSIETFGQAPVIGAIPWLDVIDRASLLRVFDSHFDKGAIS